MSISKVHTKKYDLINQCYTVFVHSIPAPSLMQSITDKDETIFWCTVSKKYIIFDHVKEVPGLKARLTSVKNIDALEL